ncbi:HNH endonuclease [Bradyrhizobium japonicum]|uniref:HNH endonuclease n=1 Tax=Bradyrhizobium japonicum TaxID=375 RepID=UPI001E5B8F48|nr:HNH endonuclease [Bradyrhizobium japonicum]MCD9817680.1 HNH endonuclease [Bradyrhizobium japonicum]MEB2672477.1 HNH endonuclease [Bradyrhizobium japonicum]WRI91738.1 HNH endonuclease [Bradyrhizobium japonicum]
MSVDELVFQAIRRPHTIDFDRLALFAFHLNNVGQPPLRGPSRPALWANEFVRNVLWRNGAWQTAALDQASIDRFIAAKMIGGDQVRTKARNNYRYFFELAGYLPTRTPTVNAGASSWIASALFLAWDRYLLDGGRNTESALLAHVRSEELHKLLGVTDANAISNARILVKGYLSAGSVRRFSLITALFPVATPAATPSRHVPSPSPTATSSEAEWLDQDGSDETVERSVVSRLAQKRNRKIASQLRLHYKHACMFCGVRLQVGEGRFYSEAAHVKPLGKPHDGPDKTDNLLVLCPNHHLQFDRGVLRLKVEGSKLRIVSIVPSDPLHNKLIAPSHALDTSCVNWHFDWFDDKR